MCGRSPCWATIRSASRQAKGALCWCTQWTATHSEVVPAASARARRHSRWASFKILVQSTAHRTIGLPAPSRTKPTASSGSSTTSAGLIQPPHIGCPIGGVTSKRNGAKNKSGFFCAAGSAAATEEVVGASPAAAVAVVCKNRRRLKAVITGLPVLSDLRYYRGTGGTSAIGGTTSAGKTTMPRRREGWPRPRRLPLTIERILAWADSFYEHTGKWSRKGSAGLIMDAAGEKWLNVDMA